MKLPCVVIFACLAAVMGGVPGRRSRCPAGLGLPGRHGHRNADAELDRPRLAGRRCLRACRRAMRASPRRLPSPSRPSLVNEMLGDGAGGPIRLPGGPPEGYGAPPSGVAPIIGDGVQEDPGDGLAPPPLAGPRWYVTVAALFMNRTRANKLWTTVDATIPPST